MSAGVSGGHLNPAVSLALAISGKLSWRKVPYYMLGQYIGAFLGAASVYFVYYGKLLKTYQLLYIQNDNNFIFPSLRDYICIADR